MLSDRRAESIRSHKGNIGANESAAAAGVAIPEQAVDAVGIGLLLWCHFAPGDRTDVFIYLHEVCDGHGNGISLLSFRGGPVIIFRGDRPGPFLIGDKAVGELLEILTDRICCAEVQRIENGLDANGIQAALSLNQTADL